jgi:hypothetical protein
MTFSVPVMPWCAKQKINCNTRTWTSQSAFNCPEWKWISFGSTQIWYVIKNMIKTFEWGTCFIIDRAPSGVTKTRHDVTFPLLPYHCGKDRVHFSTGFIQKETLSIPASCRTDEISRTTRFFWCFFYWQYLSNGGCRAKGIMAIHHHWHIQYLFEVRRGASAINDEQNNKEVGPQVTSCIKEVGPQDKSCINMYKYTATHVCRASPTNSVTYEPIKVYERWSYRSETAVDEEYVGPLSPVQPIHVCLQNKTLRKPLSVNKIPVDYIK